MHPAYKNQVHPSCYGWAYICQRKAFKACLCVLIQRIFDFLIKQDNYSRYAITTALVWERTLVKYTPPHYCCASVITVLGKHINSAAVNLLKCKPLLQYEPADRCRSLFFNLHHAVQSGGACWEFLMCYNRPINAKTFCHDDTLMSTPNVGVLEGSPLWCPRPQLHPCTWPAAFGCLSPVRSESSSPSRDVLVFPWKHQQHWSFWDNFVLPTPQSYKKIKQIYKNQKKTANWWFGEL